MRDIFFNDIFCYYNSLLLCYYVFKICLFCLQNIIRIGRNKGNIPLWEGPPYSPLTASANWLNAWRSMERGVPMFKRMKPLPPGPNISPSFNAR